MAELCSNFGDSAITKGQMAYFPLRMRETAKCLLSIKNLTTASCSPTPIFYKKHQFWRLCHKYGPNCIFVFIVHAQNGHISTSCQKSDITVTFMVDIAFFIFAWIFRTSGSKMAIFGIKYGKGWGDIDSQRTRSYFWGFTPLCQIW